MGAPISNQRPRHEADSPLRLDVRLLLALFLWLLAVLLGLMAITLFYATYPDPLGPMLVLLAAYFLGRAGVSTYRKRGSFLPSAQQSVRPMKLEEPPPMPAAVRPTLPAPTVPALDQISQAQPNSPPNKESWWTIVGWAVGGTWLLMFLCFGSQALDTFGVAVGVTVFCLLWGRYQNDPLADVATGQIVGGALGCLWVIFVLAFYLFITGGLIWLALKFFRLVTGLH